MQTLPARDGDPEPPPDNGQHIALGCFAEYLRFLDRIGESRLGAAHAARAAGDRRGPVACRAFVRRPLRSSPTGICPLRDRLRIPLVLARLRRAKARDGETFGATLRRLGASDAAVDRFWDVFIRPALNLPADEVDARRRALHRAHGSARARAPTPTSCCPSSRSARCTATRPGARSRRPERRFGWASASSRSTSSTPMRSSSRRRRARARGCSTSPIPATKTRRSSACTSGSTDALLTTPLAALAALGRALGLRPGRAHRARSGTRPVPHGRVERCAGAARRARQGARRPYRRTADRAARRCGAPVVARQPRALRDDRASPGRRASRRRDHAARRRARRDVDRHRLARDDGERSTQRTRSCRTRARAARGVRSARERAGRRADAHRRRDRPRRAAPARASAPRRHLGRRARVERDHDGAAPLLEPLPRTAHARPRPPHRERAHGAHARRRHLVDLVRRAGRPVDVDRGVRRAAHGRRRSRARARSHTSGARAASRSPGSSRSASSRCSASGRGSAWCRSRPS